MADLTNAIPPSIKALAARAVALRWWVLGLLAIGRSLIDATSGLTPIDFGLFGRAGDILLSTDWLDAYNSSFIQTGVISLAIHGAVGLGERIAGIDSRIWFSLVAQVGVTILLVLATRRAVTHIRGECPPWLELCVGVVALIGQTTWTAYISGHPSDAVVAVLWILAAADAREDRPLRAGLLLALSAGFKQWGLLGAPLLLLGPRTTRSIKGFSVQLAGTLAMYAPFFIWGEFNTFDKEWTVASLSLPRLFLPADAFFPWWMRLVQGAFVIVVGVLAARALRDRATAVWIVPAALVIARVLSEPFGNYYHWSAFDLIALVGVAGLLLDGRLWPRVAIGVGLYVELLALYFPAGLAGTMFVYRLLFAGALIAMGIRSSTIRSPAFDSG